MFKQELPLIFPDDADVKAVAEAMFDPFEYLVLRDKDGLLKKDFKQPLGKVSYHIPCHSRVQNVGQKTREVLEWVPGTEVNTVERCAGHDGTYGVKKEFYASSMKIGKPVFRRMARDRPRLRELRLPDRRAPHHPGDHRGRRDARPQGAPDHADPHRLRSRRLGSERRNAGCPGRMSNRYVWRMVTVPIWRRRQSDLTRTRR